MYFGLPISSSNSMSSRLDFACKALFGLLFSAINRLNSDFSTLDLFSIHASAGVRTFLLTELFKINHKFVYN